MEIEIMQMSFLDLLNTHRIVIPIIQRDYVQGRSTERIKEIRSSFLDDIINCLKDESKKLNLGFIYGKVLDKNWEEIKVKNKEAIENVLGSLKEYANHLDEEIQFEVNWKSRKEEKELSHSKFIPLDGQQRLTTLFLLHWYLLQNRSYDYEDFKPLRGFNYNTREQTQNFIVQLVDVEFKPLKGKSLKEQITTQTWFFNEWLNDPSVMAMLNTLDDIHSKLEGETEFFYEGLKNGRIDFDFLDLDKIEQTDEIYVKMNARGKSLSDFEHFKAWLIGYVKKWDQKEQIIFKEWERKLDLDWLDLFWSKNIVSTTDIAMLMFFQHQSFVNLAFQGNKSTFSELYSKVKSTKFENRYLSFDEYKKLIYPDALNHIFNSLSALKNSDLVEINSVIETSILRENFNLLEVFCSRKSIEAFNLNDDVFNQGLLLYILKLHNETRVFESENFKKWVRILRNLTANTFIQGSQEFFDALFAIKELSNYCFDVEDYIIDESNEVKFFLGRQQDEERLKLKKIGLGIGWRQAIEKFENNKYFNGQIGFFFDILEESEQNDLELFLKYGNKLDTLFSEVLDNNYSEFQGALLALGDYTFRRDSKWSFLDKSKDLRTKFDNWRKVFRKDFKNPSGEIPFEYLKSLVRDSRDYKTIRKETKPKDWRYIFVRNKALIEYCSNNVFNYNYPLDIHLLKGKTFVGKSVDAYLYFLFKYLNKKHSNLDLELIEINGNKTIDKYARIKCFLEKYETVVFISYETNEKSGFIIELDAAQITEKSTKIFSLADEIFIKQDIKKVYKMEIDKDENAIDENLKKAMKQIENFFHKIEGYD